MNKYTLHYKMEYWTHKQIKKTAQEEIKKTACHLLLAYADPEELNGKDVITWLVELKIKSILDNRCRFCSRKKHKCKCALYCDECSADHNGIECKKNIMNSHLLKLIFHSNEIKNNIAAAKKQNNIQNIRM